MSKIMWINPIATDIFDSDVKNVLLKAKRKETDIEVVSLEKGPEHLLYRYYEALAIPGVLRTIKEAENDNYDAAVIGCFYDPGLCAARQISENIVVTAPLEATVLIATTLGYKFSIIATHDVSIPIIMDSINNYGLKDKVASIKSLDMGVHDLLKDEEEIMENMKLKAKEAVEKDLAEVIILGCTFQSEYYKEIQDYIKVPVLDPVIVSFKYAEFLVELKKKFGWIHSKKNNYMSPPVSEMIKWRLEE